MEEQKWSKEKLKSLNYRTVDTLELFNEMLAEIFQANIVACDIETQGLDPYLDETKSIVSIQFCTKPKTGWFVPLYHKDKVWSEQEFNTILRGLRQILEGDTFLIGHNFKFDSKWILKKLGIKPKLNFDTMLAHGLFEETSSSLKKLAYTMTDLGGYEEEQKAYTEGLEDNKYDMYYYPLDALSIYGCCDVDVTYRIFEILNEKLIEDPQKMFLFKVLISASRAFLDIEHEGIKIDTDYLKQLDTDLSLEILQYKEEFKQKAYIQISEIEEELKQEAIGKSGKVLKNKPIEFNIDSSKDVSRLFYDKMGCRINNRHRSKKTDEPSVGRKALEDLAKKYPIADTLIKYRGLYKQKTSFVDSYPKFTDSNNRIHPDYQLIKFYSEDTDKEIGTYTGRLSCIEENQLISLLNGEVPIKDVKIGDLVYSYNDQQKPTLSKVLKVIDNGIRECINIKWQSQGVFDEGNLVCTPGHLVLTKDAGWKPAGCLTLGDVILHVRRNQLPNGRVRVYGSYGFQKLEEQIVKEEYFKAQKQDHIHHINEVKSDNRLENFQILSNSQHSSLHMKEKASKGLIKWEHLKLNRPTLTYGVDNPIYINKSRFELLRMLAKAKGRPTYVEMDFNTFKLKCEKVGISIDVIQQRYGEKLNYISRGSILSAYTTSSNTEEVSKKLGIGTRKLKRLCSYYNISYNHRVIGLSYVGDRQVYDLEIENTHNFIAEELCVHNCRNPNLQQVPARDETKRIKKLFIPDYKEHYLMDCDFSGIELRVTAMLCQDPIMMAFFNEGEGDFHRYVASKVYDKPEDQVTKLERTYAKSTTFGILYGAGPNKIAEQAKCTVKQAEEFIEEYFKLFPTLKKWILRQKAFASRNLYVKSMFGRVRSLPDANSNMEGIRERALRRAVNSVVQSDASDITLYSLTRIANYLNKFEHSDPDKPSRLRGSVHDSILISVHKEDLTKIAEDVKFNILEDIDIPFIKEKGVRLQAEVSIGRTWGTVKELK